MTDERPMTLGEKLAGTNFNPSGDPNVQAIKQACADLLDEVFGIKAKLISDHGPEAQAKKLIADAALVNIQTAQMQIVKLATWK